MASEGVQLNTCQAAYIGGTQRGRFMGNSKGMVSNLMKRYSTLYVKFRTMILILGCLVHEFKIF